MILGDGASKGYSLDEPSLTDDEDMKAMAASATVRIDLELEVPEDMARLSLPEGVDRRLQALLDKQDRGELLTDDERVEAEGLVDLSDLLSLLRLRSSRGGQSAPRQ